MAAVARQELEGALPDFTSVLDLLARVDDLGPDAVGTLVFARTGEKPAGAIFIEAGRVCWALAHGLARRLTDLLLAGAGGALDRPVIEALYRECRITQRPIGEVLVERGLVTAEALRAAHLSHTCESILALTGAHALTWLPRRSGGYSPRFTFGTGELTIALARQLEPRRAASVGAELARVANDEAAAIGFLRSPHAAVPLPLAALGAAPASLQELVTFARLVVSMRDMATAVASPLKVVCASLPCGRTLVSFGDDPLVLAAVSDDPMTTARVLRRAAS